MAERTKTFKKTHPPEALPDLAVKFIETLTYSAGVRGTVKLRAWQEEIIRSILAVGADGLRIVRKALIMMPRKNAKTELMAWLILVLLLIDSEHSQRIASAAKTFKQAGAIYTAVSTIIRANEKLSAIFESVTQLPNFTTANGTGKYVYIDTEIPVN